MIDPCLSHKSNGGSNSVKEQGFSLLELMVVILLLCGIYYVLIDRLMYYRAQYETAEVGWTLAALRASRQIEQATGAKDISSSGSTPGVRNPMRLLSRLPTNYIGEICNPQPGQVEGGSWYFDTCNLWLVYVYNSEKFFASEYPKILKFNVESLRLLTVPARNSQKISMRKYVLPGEGVDKK